MEEPFRGWLCSHERNIALALFFAPLHKINIFKGSILQSSRKIRKETGWARLGAEIPPIWSTQKLIKLKMEHTNLT